MSVFIYIVHNQQTLTVGSCNCKLRHFVNKKRIVGIYEIACPQFALESVGHSD